MMINIFTYGSLMFNQVWRQVVKGNYKSKPGILIGYERRALKGEIHPCLIKGSPANKLEGIVYINVVDSDVQILDRFEGSEYKKVKETCLLRNGAKVETETYVWNGSLEWVSLEPWDAERFEKEEIQLFIRKYKGFTN